VPHKAHMTFRLEKTRSGSVTTVRLIGRLRSEHVEELRKHLEHEGAELVVDLSEVSLVDREVVRFLIVCENQGVEIVNTSPYIRKWMQREREEPEF